MSDRKIQRTLVVASVLLASWSPPHPWTSSAWAAPSSEAQGYLEKAQASQKKGDANAAILQLKNALRVDPDLTQARYELGILYLVTGDPGAAQRELEAARARGYDVTKLIEPLTRAYLAQGRFQEVIKDFNPEEFSGNAQSSLMATQARAHMALQAYAAARTLLDKAMAQSPKAPDVLLAAATLARLEQRYPDANTYIDQGLAADPDNGELMVMKAEGLQQNKDYDGALKYIDKAIDKYPRFARARVARAMLNLARGKGDLIGDDVKQLLSLDPKNPLGLYLRAYQLAQEQKYRDAVQVLLALPEFLDAYPPARYLLAAASFADNQIQSALSNAELYLKKSPNEPNGVKLLAAILLRANDPKRAADVLEPLAKERPDDNQVRLQLATAYMGIGRSDEAIKLFQEGLKEDPKNDQARLALAMTDLRSGATSAGVDELQKIIQAKPDALEANALLVMTHLQARRLNEALAAADAMIKANPKNPRAYNLRGTVNLASNDLKAAKASFQLALDQDSKFAPAFLNLARIDAQAKEMDSAKNWYRKAISADPASLTSYYGLADIYLGEKKPEEAAKVLEQAISSNVSNPDPRLRLVDLRLRERQLGQALVAARELMNVLPDDPRSADALGRVQIASGDFANAVGTFRKLAAQQPQNPEAQRRLAGALLAAASGPARGTSADKSGTPQPPVPVKDWDVGLTNQGKAALDAGIALSPDYPAVLSDRLNLEKQLSGDAAAVALTQKWVQERPDSVSRLVLAGNAAAATGSLDAAAGAYRKAWDKSKNSDVLARLYAVMVQQKKEAEGLKLLTTWAADNPKDYATRFLIASIYLNSGRYDEALKQTDAMSGVLPDNPVLLNNLAWLYGQKNDPKAFTLAERAADIAPSSPDVLDTLGWLETTKRDAKKGLGLLTKSFELAPKNPSIAFHYASALKRTGDVSKAKDVLKNLLTTKTQFSERAEAESLLKELGG